MNLLLSPHHDDETLFAAYTLLRHRPHVVVCFDGGPRYGMPKVRKAETAAAMGILGCTWEPLYGQGDLAGALKRFDPVRVFAPLPESRGNFEHNLAGTVAADLWPDRVTYYTTYTPEGRTTLGEPVLVEDGWEALKRQALDCYRSQIAHPGTRPHFFRPLDEYLVAADALRVAA